MNLRCTSLLKHSAKSNFSLTQTTVASCVLYFFLSIASLHSQEVETEQEEQRQVQIAERFLSVLEKSPRRGTALDRVYGHHVEFGTLESFLARLNKELEAEPGNGAKWMLLGLFAAQRGDDAVAIEAFSKAEELRPTDALAPYYASQSMLRLGESQSAIQAMERAIACNPARTDLMEIYQQLGRVHQRAQRTDAALEVWKRFETEFPDDPRVLEQIAVILAEENQPELAVPRYERLIELVDDDYRKTMFRIAASELKIKTAGRDKALADFESILKDLNPSSWLHRDVRRRIEEIYLRSGDQDSLVKYYQSWLERNPEDVEGMARLAKFLSASARVPEAMGWIEKALKLAPTRADLRKAFIDQLVEQQRFSEAAEQYAKLVEADPSNTDFLRDWGKLVLRDREQDESVRKSEASKIWNRIVASHESDALIHAQVADLFRNAGIPARAIELYQKAIELAPDEAQYREYLGEYYHIQKQSELALQTWAKIAEPPRNTALNLARSAEVHNSFGYLDQAMKDIAAACEMEQKDLALQLQAATYFIRAEKFSDALIYIDRGAQLASNVDQQESVLSKRIELFQSSQQLREEIQRLSVSLNESSQGKFDDWYRLARYQEAYREWEDAVDSILKAANLAPDSTQILSTQARIQESSGDFGSAAKTYRKLSTIDRRSQDEYIMNVARLEMQLGRADEALAAANELIVASPANTDNYEFLAQMCFRLGREKEGLDALRKAVRINPNEPHLMMALGSALADQLETREAIELYWRAFDKSEELDDKTSLTTKLVPLYQQLNQLDQLFERFQRERMEEDNRRMMTICLAQAYQSSGDIYTARQELESLLSEETRDTNLLQQLSKLCQANGEMDSAVSYQRQLVAIAPGHETEFALAGLLQSVGNRDEATEILVRLTRREEDPIRLLRSLDALIRQGSNEAVIDIVAPMLSQQRDDWELLYREALAWKNLEKFEEASNRLDRILEIKLPHDQLSKSAAEQLKQAERKAKSDSLRGLGGREVKAPSPLTFVSSAYEVRAAIGLSSEEEYYQTSQAGTIWTPRSFGLARLAAYGWKIKFAQEAQQKSVNTTNVAEVETESQPSIEQQLAAAGKAEGAPRESLYDWLYVASLLQRNRELVDVARILAKESDQDAKRYFLSTLPSRGFDPSSPSSARSADGKPILAPLSDEDIELMLDCYRDLTANAKKDDDQTYGGQIVYSANGQAYVLVNGSYQMISQLNGFAYLGQVLSELRLAGKDDLANRMRSETIDSAKTASGMVAAMTILMQEKEYELISKLFDRWYVSAMSELKEFPLVSNDGMKFEGAYQRIVGQIPSVIGQWFGTLGVEEENQKILEVLDKYLDVAELGFIRKLESDAMQKSKRRRTPTSQQSTTLSFNWNYGNQSNYVRQTVPVVGKYHDQQACIAMLQAYMILKRNDVAGDLISLLRKRSELGESKSKMLRRMTLANVLWWEDERDEAVTLCTSALEEVANDVDVAFQLSNVYMQQNDLERAFNILEQVQARDQDVIRQRELMILNIAERLGKTDRAQQAAERLFGLRLDAAQQMSLMQPLRRLGLNEMAEAVLARAQRSAGSQVDAQASLMTLYQGQGKSDEAKKLALIILQRTPSPLAQITSLTRNPRYYSSNNSQSNARSQALGILTQTGLIKEQIAKLESQLERTPDSMTLYEQLIELCEVAALKDKALDYTKKASELRPKSGGWHFKLADLYSKSNQLDKACDEYLEVIKYQPSIISNDFYSVRNLFTRAKRTNDLIDAVAKCDLKAIGQYYYVAQMIAEVLRESPNSEQAIQLLERAMVAFNSQRQYFMENLRDSNIWKSDRVFEIGKKGLLPTKLQANLDPWFGLSRISSYSMGGKVNTSLDSILTGIRGTPKATVLEKDVQSLLTEAPAWKAGHYILAMIKISNGNQEEAKALLKSLLDDEEQIKEMPAASAWIIGQFIDGMPEMADKAEKLLKYASENNQVSTSGFQYSPDIRLVTLYASSGKKDAARELLLKHSKLRLRDNYNEEYETYQFVQSAQYVATELQKLGFAADALRLSVEMLADKEKLQIADRYNGRTNFYAGKFEQLIDTLIESVQGETLESFLLTLLPNPNESDGKTSSQRSLLTLSVKSEADGSQSLDCDFVELLEKLSLRSEFKEPIRNRIRKLSEENLDHLSLQILNVLTEINSDDYSEESISRLLKLVGASPLEPIAEGRKANTRHGKEAFEQIPLWLVARALLSKEIQSSAGTALAERALEAARRQVKSEFANVIYDNWAQIEISHQRFDEAKDLLTKQLAISIIRPTSKQAPPRSPASAGAGSSPSEGKIAVAQYTAPLTLSQFNQVLRVAHTAAKNNFTELSMQAVRESLKGGMPVNDVTVDSNSPFGGYSNVTVMSAGSISGIATVAEDPNVDVVLRIHEVVKQWAPDKYPADEIYNLLKAFIVPENRPQEVKFYAIAVGPESKAESLAATLIDWADSAKKLDEFQSIISEREKHPQAVVTALTIHTLIDLKRKNYEDAKVSLQKLQRALEQDANTAAITTAGHAALIASDIKLLEAEAYAILSSYVKAKLQSSASSQSTVAPSDPIAERVNAYLTRSNNVEQVKAYYEQVLNTNQAVYARSSGEYAVYRMAMDLTQFAVLTAKNQMNELALDFLGRSLDIDTGRYGPVNSDSATAAVIVKMRELPLEKRYEQWKQWTLPTENRQTIRITIIQKPHFNLPNKYLKKPIDINKLPTEHFWSNLSELVDCADQLGKIAELKSLAADAAQVNAQDSALISLLCDIRVVSDATRDNLEKAIQEYLTASYEGGLSNNTDIKPRTHFCNLLLFDACLNRDVFFGKSHDRFEDFDRYLREKTFAHFRPYAFHRIGEKLIQQFGSSIQPGPDPRFKHWIPSTLDQLGSRPATSWWYAQNNAIGHLTGGVSDTLFFKYPLSGDFTFEVDAFIGGWGECDLGFNGIIVETQKYGETLNVSSLSQRDTIQRPQALKGNRPGYGRLRVESKEGRVKFFLNKHLVYEEDVSQGSPWLTLAAHTYRQAMFRNLNFIVPPSIPREVNLISDKRLDGWLAVSGDTTPMERVANEKVIDENSSLAYQQRELVGKYDWSLANNELSSPVKQNYSSGVRHVHYQRPLQVGDKVRYEFFYESGQQSAHPVIGGNAILLRPDGIIIADVTASVMTAAIAELKGFSELEKEASTLVARLPFTNSDWNAVEVEMLEDDVLVRLNGVDIYRTPVKDLTDRRFGFARPAGERLRVRSAILSGNWPEQVPSQVELCEADMQLKPADWKVFDALTDSTLRIPEASELLDSIQQLSSKDAYQRLLDWVVPNESRVDFRLHTFVLPLSEQEDLDADSIDFERYRSPAQQLIRIAADLDLLDELHAKVEEVSSSKPLALRAKNAMLALIAIAKNDIPEAKRLLVAISEQAKAPLPRELSISSRSSELLVVLAAGRHPDLWPHALELASVLRSLQRNPQTAASEGYWNDMLHGAISSIVKSQQQSQMVSEESLTQWNSVPYLKPEGRFSGQRPSSWKYDRGYIQHVPGEAWSQLFFQSPLRGKFKVSGRRTSFDYAEVPVAVGMISATPMYDLSGVKLTQLMHGSMQLDGKLQLPSWDRVHDFLIEVDGQKVTTFANGVRIHEEVYPAPLDPWLVIQAESPYYFSSLSDIKIMGEPTIPDEINLLDLHGFISWRADDYGDWFVTETNEAVPFNFVNGELHGNLRTNRSAKFAESLIKYARPMLEDGTIEYEMMYNAGTTEVHPALGDIALILSPSGVQLHQLTLGQFGSDRREPDNMTPVKDSTSIPLKDSEWNHVKLDLKGSILHVSVNGTNIAEVAIEQPSNERFFGLFRYSDQTKFRVRNMRYRGQWPKELPRIEDQELSSPAGGPLQFTGSTSSKVIDLSSVLNQEGGEVKLFGEVEDVSKAESGVRWAAGNYGAANEWPRFVIENSLSADSQITLSYRDLKIDSVKSGWGRGFGLLAVIDDQSHSQIAFNLQKNSDGTESVRCVLSREDIGGKRQEIEAVSFAEVAYSGRLQLVRRAGQIHCLMDSGEPDQFKVLHTFTIGSKPISRLELRGMNSDNEGQTTIVLDRLEIQGD